MDIKLMSAAAGNTPSRRLTRLEETFEEESSSREAEEPWKCEDFNWTEGIPHRSSMASTAYTESEQLHKSSIDLFTLPHVQVHCFPTSHEACHKHYSPRSNPDVFDTLSDQDLTKALADVKSLQELVEHLDTEIENVSIRDLNKPLRKLRCFALPEGSTLMRRRSTNP
jgi:hypothetical protein